MTSHQDMPQTWPGPIFIVGPPRSGTELLRSILNRHSSIHVSDETHYFDDLRPKLYRKGVPAGPEGLVAAADALRSLLDRSYGLTGDPARSALSREVLVAKASRIGPGPDALFEAFCRHDAERASRRVWGEKTPRHVFRIDDLLIAFPHAKVICMVRDARGVIASYRDWQNRWFDKSAVSRELLDDILAEERRTKQSYNLVILSLLWRASVNAALSGAKRHGAGRVRILRYESLLARPTEEAGDLCGWLGLGFEPGMLDVTMVNSSYIDAGRTHGISLAPAYRWREALSQQELSVANVVCGRLLQTMGYDAAPMSGGIWNTVVETAKLPAAGIRALRANRHRYSNPIDYVLRRAFFALVSRK
jgi:hypothetical protein